VTAEMHQLPTLPRLVEVVVRVRDTCGTDVALSVLRGFGVSNVHDLAPLQRRHVIRACEEVLQLVGEQLAA
jgi:hypothetical protein